MPASISPPACHRLFAIGIKAKYLYLNMDMTHNIWEPLKEEYIFSVSFILECKPE